MGSIVGMQSAEIQQIASEYAEKVSGDIDFTFSRKICYLYTMVCVCLFIAFCMFSRHLAIINY